MVRQYKNYAFISYKREDEKWAKWLQRKLESYKLPSVIRKESLNMPKYIRPVFRDKTDLSGGILTKQLHNELERSKYLIVICSPNSAQSTWVNKEAQTFVDEGRTKYIIPFIVEGVPHAEELQKECFPEVLRNIPSEQELLGINVQEIGREKAFIRLAAYMIGVSFDTLWQRYRRQERQKKVSLVVCALLLMGLGVFYWDYTRATCKYYADYVDCWGVPKGVIELNEEQVSHRYRSYKFEYRRIPFGEPNVYDWRLVKVSYVNSAGSPREYTNTEFQDRYAIQKIEYSKENGAVIRINYCRPSGKIVLRHDLSERNGVVAAIADFKASSEEKGAGFIGANYSMATNRSLQKSKIKRFAYIRDKNGYIIKQTFHSNNDDNLAASNIRDRNGIFGIAYNLDSLGRCVRIQYLNKDGKLHCTRKGVVGKNYEYNLDGDICKVVYMGLDGNPILNEEQWAILTVNYGKNYMMQSFFDEKGNMSEYKGVAKIVSQWDTQGNIVKQSFINKQGKMRIGAFSIITYRYDVRGNVIEKNYLDKALQLCHGDDGYAKMIAKYDVHGNVIESFFFDAWGSPGWLREGYSKVTFGYDSQGNNCTEVSYFDGDGTPCCDKEGTSKVTYEYNNQGNIIKKTYYDTKGETSTGKGGYGQNSIETFGYDNQGNCIEASYFDDDGNPCCNKDGYSKVTYKYDNQGNCIEESYFDTKGNPSTRNGEYGRISIQYDSLGNAIELAFFDVYGRICYNDEGYAKVTQKYDTRGFVIETAYRDIDGNLCNNKYGYARITNETDWDGNAIFARYYNADGALIEYPHRTKL